MLEIPVTNTWPAEVPERVMLFFFRKTVQEKLLALVIKAENSQRGSLDESVG